MRQSKIALIQGATALVMLLAPHCAKAGEPPSVGYPAERVILHAHARTFQSLLKEVCIQTHRQAFIDGDCDTSPTDFDFDGDAKVALDKLGNTFDYSWKLSKTGAILFHKQFKDPQSIPQVHLLEIQRTASEISRLLSGIAPPSAYKPRTTVILGFYDRLREEQRLSLQAHNTLRFTDLERPQQIELESILRHEGFAAYAAIWSALSEELDELPRSFLQMRAFPNFYQLRAHIPHGAEPQTAERLDFVYVVVGHDGTERALQLSSRKPRATDGNTVTAPGKSASEDKP